MDNIENVNKNNLEKVENTENSKKKRKNFIIALLSGSLLLTGATAITVPLVMQANKGARHTIIFNSNGGSNVPNQIVIDGENAVSPAVTWTGHKFVGWYTNSSCTGAPFNFSTKIKKNLTLYAKWEIEPEPTGITYTVTFDCDGGSSISPQTVIEGNKAVKPESPTKQGYTFVNWNDAETSTEFDFNTPILRNRTLKANWAVQPVTTTTVTFISDSTKGKFADGSTQYPQSIQIGTTFNQLVSKPEVVPNDEWEHSGWVDKDNKAIDGTKPITSPTNIYVNYKQADINVDINFIEKCLSTIGGTVKVTSGSKSMPVKKNITWAEISNNAKPTVSFTWDEKSGYSTIPTFAGWGLKEQDTIDPTEIAEALIPSDYKFSDKSTALYPWFTFEEATQMLTLQIVSIEGQTIEGDTTIEVPYKNDETNKSIIKKFSQLSKPQVTQGKKVFEGYYHTYDASTNTFSNKWSNDDEVTPDLIEQYGNKIYVKMEDVDNTVAISFIEPTETEKHNYTWTGPTELKCERGKKLKDIAPKVFKDATSNPSAEYGYTSDYYFVQWYNAETKKSVSDTTVVNSAMSFYPEFKQKPELTFNLDDSESPSTANVKVDPNGLWRDVVQPTAANKPSHWFVGWQGAKPRATTGYDYVDLTETTLLSDLDLTKPIKPKYESYDNCHTIIVSTTAAVDNGNGTLGEKTGIVYRGCAIESGNYQYGIPMSETQDIYLEQITKPFVPCSPTDKEGKETYNKGIKFNNQWQIKTSDNSWETITKDTKIDAASEKQTITIRPIVSEQFKVVFKSGDGGTITGQSEYMTTSTVAFKDMDKPTVTANEGLKFVGWKDSDGLMVENSTTFAYPDEGNVELTAVYQDSKIYTKINYHIFEDELKDANFPATPINSDNNFTSVKTDTKKTNYKYDDFDHLSAERKYYSFIGWGYQYTGKDTTDVYTHGGKKYKLITSNTIIKSGESLDLYAIFTQQEGQYVKFTIASSGSGEPEYTIKGDNKFFAKTGDAFPFHETTQQIIGFDITVSAVGYEIDYWKDANGNKLSGTIQPGKSYENIYPHFKQSKRKVSFSNNGDTTIQFTDNDQEIAREIPYNAKLSEYVGSEATKSFLDSNYPKAPKVKKGVQDFKYWAIKQGDELVEVTNDYIVESNITLVPVFYEESVFQYGVNPYFYDEEKEDWAEIIENNIDDEFLKVKYTDGQSGKTEKESFNYEVRLGKNMTKIPDNFMNGCNKWNNDGKTLEIPEKVVEIGKNFLYGCYSYNQKITMNMVWYNIISAGTNYFKIGENFMRECYSFNNDICLSSNAASYWDAPCLMICPGFMFDCQNFNKNVILKGWSRFYNERAEEGTIKDYLNCLSISDPYLYQTHSFNFNVVVSKFTGQEETVINEFVKQFPALSGEITIEGQTIPTPYRYITVKAE